MIDVRGSLESQELDNGQRSESKPPSSTNISWGFSCPPTTRHNLAAPFSLIYPQSDVPDTCITVTSRATRDSSFTPGVNLGSAIVSEQHQMKLPTYACIAEVLRCISSTKNSVRQSMNKKSYIDKTGYDPCGTMNLLNSHEYFTDQFLPDPRYYQSGQGGSANVATQQALGKLFDKYRGMAADCSHMHPSTN